ncbi:MAG: hypothetical protein IKM38_02050, partial [Christensenellaceae bacterium]|nr:hypothetical protein [Christensenellaceae bacterium]
NGLLKIGREEFSCIIIPYCQYIRRDVLLSLIKLKKDGFNVIFANEAPEGCCEDNAALPEGTDLIPAIPLSDLAAELDSIRDIKTSGYEHFLHYHHFIKDGEHYYFFLNGDMRTTIDTEVTFLNENRTMKIRLMPLESLLVKMSDICQKESHEVLDINEWTVSIEGFEEKRVIKELIDIGSDDKLVYFSGRIIYEGQFHIDDPSSATAIDLGEVCDGAEVRINGNDLGLTVYAPYRLPVNDALTEGMNTVRIEVRVSPERKPMDANGFRAFFVGTSTPTYMVKTKMGLFGPLSLIRKES